MKQSKFFQFALRVLIYCIGLLVIAFGVAISVNSNLGVSPVNSLPYVVSQIINVPMGTCVTVIFCFYILLQVLLLGKKFKPIQLLQIVFSTLFGYFVDFAKWAVGDFAIPTYFGQLAMLAISIILIALGVLLYMDVKLVPMPMEGLSSCIADKLSKPFPTMKTVVDCIVVAIGTALCFIFLGGLDGIREGTIITAIVTGKVIGLMKKPISPLIEKLCFKK
ncbi:MAG: hypothetical protein E7439_05190 [Ruminococcaceae bacterium]|nr:hypothetical protein [Oscillospiraceae bacterium]